MVFGRRRTGFFPPPRARATVWTVRDVRCEITCWLRVAVEAYGSDFPLRLPARPTPDPPLPAVCSPAPAPAIARADGPCAENATGDEPRSLEELARSLEGCRRCKLSCGRTHLVFGEGHPHARVMFVGEAPGRQEDLQGRPFVGPAGQLLDRILENAMGLRREEVYIANVNKCRPPDNRDPEPDEVAACLPFLRRQIRLIRPEVLVTLGRVATHNLLGVSTSMRRLRGQDHSFEGIPVVPTWHPAYLLRQPSAKAETWEDIKKVNRLLGLPEVPPRRTR